MNFCILGLLALATIACRCALNGVEHESILSEAVREMMIIVVSDCPANATKIRQALSKEGHDCPSSHIFSIETAIQQISAKAVQPNLILLATPQDREATVETFRRLHAVTSASILVIGPRDASLILDVVRAGASDYIDENGDLRSELATAISRIAELTQNRSQPGRFITVCGSSGGSGRTFLATNLAVALSRTQSRACLLDLDLQGGDAAASLNLKPRYSVCDLCQNIEQLDQKMFEQSLLEHSTSLSVLASPERWFDGERLSAEGLQKLLRLSRASFTDIVIDLNCFWQHEYTELLQQSSAVLFVLRQDFAAVRNARRALVQLERMGVDKSHIHIVANFHGQPKEIDEAKVESALDAKIRHRLPWDPKTVNLCVNCGTPVVLEAPGSQLANAIVNIAYVLDGREPGTHGAASSLEASWQQSVTRIRTLLEDKARLWRTALPAQFRPHNS